MLRIQTTIYARNMEERYQLENSGRDSELMAQDCMSEVADINTETQNDKLRALMEFIRSSQRLAKDIEDLFSVEY